MKIQFISYRKYHPIYPLWFNLKNIIHFEKSWSGKIWHLSFWNIYAIDFDFRKGNLFNWIYESFDEKQKQSFLERWFMKRN